MIGVDLGIFGLLQERSPQTKEELARASKCDEVLMGESVRNNQCSSGFSICTGRILATLVSFSILNQLDVNSFAATPVCATLADPKYQAWLDSAYAPAHTSHLHLELTDRPQRPNILLRLDSNP